MTELDVAPGTLRAGADEGKRTSHPIVVATSGEDGAAALRAAELLASRTKSDVVVLSVVMPDPATPYDPQFGFVSPEYEAIRRDIRTSSVRRQLLSATTKGAEWPIDVQFGSPPVVIADEARRRDASLVIMDGGRHGLIDRLLTGETALRTIRRARTPVLAVVGELASLPRVAVAAIDFSPASIAAARASLALLADDAKLYLVHVWSRSASDHPSERARDDAYESSLPELFDRAEKALRVPPGIAVHRITLLGSPAEAILDFATSHGAELIAAGRRGYGFFERLLVGSTTAALLRGSRCSLLVTPEPTGAQADEIARAVTGVFESRSPEEWSDQLDRFSRRNRGRRVALEVDDPHVGTQMQAVGYALIGATYDRNDRSVRLMLAHPEAESAHLTHSIRNVAAIAVRSDRSGNDQALRVDHRDGWVVMRFEPDQRPQRDTDAS